MSWIEQQRKTAKEQYAQTQAPKLVYGLGIFNKLEFQWKEPTVTRSTPIIVADGAVKASQAQVEKYSFKLATDKFTLFHKASLDEVQAFVVPKNTKATVHCRWQGAIAHLLIIVEDGAQVVVEEESEGKEDYSSHITELYVGKNAQLTYSSVQNKKSAFHYVNKSAHVERDGRIILQDCILGCDSTKSEIVINLDGENASADHQGIYFAKNKQVFDAYTTINHNVSHTTSNMRVRGAIDDKAKAIYRGLVHIKPGARLCDGKQFEETLLLGEDSEVNVVPTLEIDTHEVKCAHSASISTLSTEKLHYLRARGFDASQARVMLLQAYFTPFVERLIHPHMKDRLNESIVGMIR
jgi:Fe-S cluster assembly scaffold protein SufB